MIITKHFKDRNRLWDQRHIMFNIVVTKYWETFVTWLLQAVYINLDQTSWGGGVTKLGSNTRITIAQQTGGGVEEDSKLYILNKIKDPGTHPYSPPPPPPPPPCYTRSTSGTVVTNVQETRYLISLRAREREREIGQQQISMLLRLMFQGKFN